MHELDFRVEILTDLPCRLITGPKNELMVFTYPNYRN